MDGIRAKRLLPALLDRLTDTAPGLRGDIAGAASASKGSYRANVMRDLSWLLNTINASSVDDLSAVDHARRSVLNFGIPAFSGLHLADGDWSEFERAIHDAIVTFEPRILPDSLRVHIIAPDTSAAARNRLALEIRGQLWCEPYPVELLLHSHVDLESGDIQLSEVVG